MMRMIVNGSRGFSNYNYLRNALKELFMIKGYNPAQVEIISGGARGADQYAIRFANEYNLKLKIMNADWGTYGKRAGIIRNQAMLDYATSDPNDKAMLISFWDGESRGTKHMIDIAQKAGIEIRLYKIKEVLNQ